MTSFFGRLFGSGKKKEERQPSGIKTVEDTLTGLIQSGGFDLSFEVHADSEEEIKVELNGEDEDLLREKDAQLMDALQLYLKRILQHQFPEENLHVSVDSNGYRKEASQALLELADKLKEIVLTKGKSVYIRALPPKDRKLVHQYLAEDGRVKSRSVGDGHFKKIKIYPSRDHYREIEPMGESAL